MSTTILTIRSLGKDCRSQRTWPYSQRLRAQELTFQEFVRCGPVAAEGDAADGAGASVFVRDLAVAEKFEEAAPRAGREKRGVAIATLGMGTMLDLIVGPVLGGYLTESFPGAGISTSIFPLASLFLPCCFFTLPALANAIIRLGALWDYGYYEQQIVGLAIAPQGLDSWISIAILSTEQTPEESGIFNLMRNLGGCGHRYHLHHHGRRGTGAMESDRGHINPFNAALPCYLGAAGLHQGNFVWQVLAQCAVMRGTLGAFMFWSFLVVIPTRC